MVKPSTTISAAFMLGAAIGLGFTITYIKLTKDVDLNKNYDFDISEFIMNEMDKGNIGRNLRRLTRKPHVAGTDIEEKEVVNFVAESWRRSGLSVEIHPYNVLLSYPNKTDPNYVAIKTSDGTEIHVSNFNEEVLDSTGFAEEIITPYQAYSPSGTVEGDLVYVNFASLEDFIALNTSLGTDVRGKICIARNAQAVRTNKGAPAELFGCKGLILYSDPKDYNFPGEGVYPDSLNLPGSGAQRWTLHKRAGDPLTLHYPSTETAWRADESDFPLPSIPITPIGFDDAIHYLSRLDGPEAPEKWKGGLNITYRLGPGFRGDDQSSKMKMHVTTKNERRTIHNVIAYIRGAVEPDRYVLFGNHRDAWAYGAIDPSSATAVILEMARVFGAAVEKGWKPRRSLVFCSWGAEEFGLIGSTEWVEEFRKNLEARAVAYLNVDSAVAGIHTFFARATPNLKQVLLDTAKVIPNPDAAEVAAGRKFVFDTWRRRFPANYTDPKSLPDIWLPGAGSDHAGFIHLLGISIVDMAYAWNLGRSLAVGHDFYQFYHTVYETYDMMTTFLDKDFLYHQATGRFWGELGIRLSDSPVLPFNCRDYAAQIAKSKDTVLKYFGTDMAEHGINTDDFTLAVNNFTLAAEEFHQRIERLDLKNQLDVRAANDQMMLMERAFIDVNGVKGREQSRHVIFPPSQYILFSGLQFPGLVDSMYNIGADNDQDKRWDEVKRQYSIILYHLGSAASTLREFVPMKGSSNM